jgi:hypothetical protein
MKSAALTTAVLLTLTASAFAQDLRKEARNDRDYQDHYSELTVGLRNSIPTGDAFDNVRWGDLVSGGIGLEIQYGYLWRANSWCYGGWFAGLNIDSFGGRSSTLVDPTTGASIDIRTDRLNVADLEFGARLRQNTGSGFHVDEHVGVGAAIYMKQQVDIRNGGASGLELIKSSVSYLLDVGVRVGAPLGKDVELGLGIAYQVTGAPSEGKDFTGIKFKSMQDVVLSLTLDFGF